MGITALTHLNPSWRKKPKLGMEMSLYWQKKEFFKHRLLTLFPRITDKGIETSITFLEQQKLANCPCFVHTEQRGFGWIVFRRQPDKITCDCDDIPEIEDDVTDDEDFLSAEADDTINGPTSDDELAIPTDDPQYNTCEQDKMQDASGAASENDITYSDFSAGYKAIFCPQVSESLLWFIPALQGFQYHTFQEPEEWTEEEW